MTEGLIGRASLVSDVIAVDPFVGVLSITAITALIGSFAGNEHLRRKIDIGPLGLAGNLDAIRQSGA